MSPALEPTDGSSTQGPSGGRSAAGAESSSEALVRVPARRTPVPPVPVAVRRARAAGIDVPVRDWTPVGTVDGGVLAEVDRGGLMQMLGCSWSLDWWIGAEDRWHHPSMEAAVRQEALDGSPVLATSLRVPGGDVVHRVGGVQATAGEWSGAAVAVEIENRTAVPVALALVIRPWRLDGSGEVSEVVVAGSLLTVDGAPVLLDRPPARLVRGSRDHVALDLAAGRDEAAGRTEKSAALIGVNGGGDQGDHEVAFVLPLAHTAVARVLLPGRPPEPARRWASPRRALSAAPSVPWAAPELDSVAAGWSAHGADDPRAVVPLAAWADLLGWSAHMLRLAGPAEITRALDPGAHLPAGPASGPRVDAVAEALAGLGSDEVNDAVAAALVGAQRFSGAVTLADGSDATAALVWSGAATLRGRHGSQRAEELVGPLAKAVHHLRTDEDVRQDGERARQASAAFRLLATALVAMGQPEVAQDALEVASSLEVGASDGHRSSSTDDRPDDEPRSTFGTALAERALVVTGDPRGLDALARRLVDRGARGVGDLLDASGRGAGGSGFDVAELAATRLCLLDELVSDGQRGPVLLPFWPSGWAGQVVEAQSVPTSWGRVSFALRWHGQRPAVLWEVQPAVGTTEGSASPEIRAPGLDPTWTGTGWSGEALLAGSPVAARSVVQPQGPTVPSTDDRWGEHRTEPEQRRADPGERPADEGDSFS